MTQRRYDKRPCSRCTKPCCSRRAVPLCVGCVTPADCARRPKVVEPWWLAHLDALAAVAAQDKPPPLFPRRRERLARTGPRTGTVRGGDARSVG